MTVGAAVMGDDVVVSTGVYGSLVATFERLMQIVGGRAKGKGGTGASSRARQIVGESRDTMTA